MTLDYAVVVATRNRLELLSSTLPLFLAQTRPAARLVVVDRSDDHASVARLCAELARTSPVPVSVEYGEAANLPAQRNQGLARVEEPVVMFPDDDSFWYPDTAQQLMQAYEADVNQRYGAISATDVYALPGSPDAVAVRRIRLTNMPAVMAVRNGLEARIVPQPFNVYGLGRIANLAPAALADGLGYPLVASIGGYRMSFRTALARRIGFDPVLGSRVGYAIHEDKDMGLRVLAEGSLIAAVPAARVFHNAAPGRRAAGFSYGFYHVFNYLYICRKVFADGSDALAATRRYLAYKTFLYGLRRADAYDRDVSSGARAALELSERVLAAPPECLAELYAELTAAHGVAR